MLTFIVAELTGEMERRDLLLYKAEAWTELIIYDYANAGINIVNCQKKSLYHSIFFTKSFHRKI